MKVGAKSILMGLLFFSVAYLYSYAYGAEIWQALLTGGVIGILGFLLGIETGGE